MIPFQKVFILIIRTASRPMLTFIRKQQQINKQSYIAKFFVSFGRKYHSFEHWLNHKILKTTHKKQLTQLKQEILMEKGIQGFYEIIFYSIVFGLPLYELYQASKSAQKKQINLNKQIFGLEKKIESVTSKLTTIIDKGAANKQKRNQINLNRLEKLSQLKNQRQKIRLSGMLKLIERKDLETTQVIEDNTQNNKTISHDVDSANQALNDKNSLLSESAASE